MRLDQSQIKRETLPLDCDPQYAVEYDTPTALNDQVEWTCVWSTIEASAAPEYDAQAPLADGVAYLEANTITAARRDANGNLSFNPELVEAPHGTLLLHSSVDMTPSGGALNVFLVTSVSFDSPDRVVFGGNWESGSPNDAAGTPCNVLHYAYRVELTQPNDDLEVEADPDAASVRLLAIPAQATGVKMRSALGRAVSAAGQLRTSGWLNSTPFRVTRSHVVTPEEAVAQVISLDVFDEASDATGFISRMRDRLVESATAMPQSPGWGTLHFADAAHPEWDHYVQCFVAAEKSGPDFPYLFSARVSVNGVVVAQGVIPRSWLYMGDTTASVDMFITPTDFDWQTLLDYGDHAVETFSMQDSSFDVTWQLARCGSAASDVMIGLYSSAGDVYVRRLRADGSTWSVDASPTVTPAAVPLQIDPGDGATSESVFAFQVDSLPGGQMLYTYACVLQALPASGWVFELSESSIDLRFWALGNAFDVLQPGDVVTIEAFDYVEANG